MADNSGTAEQFLRCMPRYFFDIADGHKFPDEHGEDLPDDEAARLEGLEMARVIEESRVGILTGALS
jgi:hypothetical protein